MPELPEVHAFHQYFKQHALNRPIQKVTVADDKIIRNLSSRSFQRRLKGRTFVDSFRRGKYLFGELDNGHHVLLHFGMTGDLIYYTQAADKPKFERFAFVFGPQQTLAFDCPRKFARILYLDDVEDYIRETKLGPDALEISEERFLELMGQRKVTIKGFLLNQHLLAGVGNLYADEVCYQCRVHPASTVAKLPPRKRRQIFAKLREILNFAVERTVYYKDYPDNWFWEWRKEGEIGKGGNPVLRAKVAGRTTYYVDRWQKMYE
ncbi:MAG: DNA-formamidopyrimidine glycosylase family protein [Bacteroidota bacterium]